ncbi:ABC transporter substrate-binding protein [Bacillus suaedaesalsae]|uniref:SgrR family transcriptional regulator n=1 Tax=Bacillus suaedaesalsae TaxID=2810349 RepID=A0ABS2DHA2_9BACI|nr:ABC transporter substrate-binding protein [Bacillus suaedaesalsae]MBM6617834.1 SgrR family transcriptional regulator [Bacillus suaedaesalsae]
MDNKLLLLWRYFPSGQVMIHNIAEKLEVSTKQVNRYLKKWTHEGWMLFTPGLGRGNFSSLEWLQHVEEVYESMVLEKMENEPLEAISKYLMFDWSYNSKMKLMTKFNSKIGYVHQSQDKLIVPKRHPFLTLHPLEAADASSGNLIANVYNRLVSMTEHGEMVQELAHSWDVTPTKLRLYLKKDVKFHDGSILTADDVVTCLEKLRIHKNYHHFWSPIEKIEAIAPLIVDLHYPGGCSYALQMLSSMCASIYKEDKTKIYGTGGFIVEEDNLQKTSLVAFKEYFQERPLLDAVEFVRVPKDFNIIYHASTDEEKNPASQIESDFGFAAVIMNPNRNSLIQKPKVRNYLRHLLVKNRNTMNQYDSRSLPGQGSCMTGQQQELDCPHVSRPSFEDPIIVRVASHTETSSNWLIDTLKKDGIPIEIKHISFSESANNDPAIQDVDLFMHGEVFELSQELSFYNFLTNGFSPLSPILTKNPYWVQHLETYKHTPFSKWLPLILETEKKLIESSIMIPLFNEKKQIPLASHITNISISHFGYIDLSKLWLRPELNS